MKFNQFKWHLQTAVSTGIIWYLISILQYWQYCSLVQVCFHFQELSIFLQKIGYYVERGTWIFFTSLLAIFLTTQENWRIQEAYILFSLHWMNQRYPCRSNRYVFGNSNVNLVLHFRSMLKNSWWMFFRVLTITVSLNSVNAAYHWMGLQFLMKSTSILIHVNYQYWIQWFLTEGPTQQSFAVFLVFTTTQFEYSVFVNGKKLNKKRSVGGVCRFKSGQVIRLI